MTDFNSLTKRGKAQRYRRALLQALEAYPIEVTSLRFIALESKPVYRVYSDSGSFAAKFHDPSEHVLSQMLGELRFLDHLSAHSELSIESPLANSSGEFVTEVNSEWLPEPAHIALCSWLPGSQLKNHISARAYRHLGRCSGMLHVASPSFEPGRDFSILTNDRVFYWDKETILSREDRRLLPRRRQELFKRGVQVAQGAINKVWRSRTPMVIHNDLHPCNIKVHRGSLSLYDFEDITWGFPEQDIGTAIYHVRFRDDYPVLLGAFRDGYEQVLRWPFDSDRQLDRFVMARLLMFANYVVNFKLRPAKHLPRFETELSTLLDEQRS